MTIALAILCLALVGLLAGQMRVAAHDRAEARVLREEADRAHRETLERVLEEVHEEAREERKELYQRIQAPEVAVAEAVREARGPYQRRQPKGHDHDIHAPEVNGG
jgi:Skp family chaperone for outer membrane proteins